MTGTLPEPFAGWFASQGSFARYYLHDIEHHAWDITGDPAGSWL